ncbi:MAG: hypothetical protein L0Z53_26470 [Acidobacteriales bacterium]|nr:hypothetical protein [Terriglobales bacterium]
MLVAMSLIGVGFGIWLLRVGEVLSGSLSLGLWLFNGQRFAIWLIVPAAAPSDGQRGISSRWQRVLLVVVCFLAAAVFATGVYLWHWWPEQWQAGLVFILFALVVLGPVTVTEIRFRKKLRGTWQSPEPLKILYDK